MKNYEYEESLDILYIYNNPDKEKAVNNFVFGNIVIDIGKTGTVLGVEIDCASKLFKIPSKQLNDLQIAKIQIMKIGSMLTLGVSVATKMKEHSFQFVIQQEQNQAKMPIVSC